MTVYVSDAVQVRRELASLLRLGGIVRVGLAGHDWLGLGEGIWVSREGRAAAVIFDLGWAWPYLADQWAWSLSGQSFLDWLALVLGGLGLGRFELGIEVSEGIRVSEAGGSVIWHCPFFRLGGYGVEGTVWASILAHRCNLYLRPQGSVVGFGSGFERDWLGIYCRDWRAGDRGKVFILNHTPEVSSYVWGNYPAVGRVMFETGQVPSGWLGYLNRMDELWVPTEWGCEVFGRVHRRVRCLGSPIDVDIYYPASGLSGGPLRFGTVTDLHSRKNLWGLLRAFADAYGPGVEVELWIRIFSVYHRDEEAERMVYSYVRDGLGRSDLLDRIRVVTGILGNGALADFYRSLDWYISLSRGEGFDRPAIEALACGCGLILSDNTAHVGLVPRDWSLWVPCSAVPVPEPVVRLEYRAAAGHEWFEPDHGAAVEALRAALECGRPLDLDGAWQRWDWVCSHYGKYVLADRWLEYASRFWS